MTAARRVHYLAETIPIRRGSAAIRAGYKNRVPHQNKCLLIRYPEAFNRGTMHGDKL